MSRQKHPPKLCHHKARGLAYVTLNGKEKYLGPWGTPEATAEYDRVIALWLGGGRTRAAVEQRPGVVGGITIDNLIARFWTHAEEYYRHPDGTATGEVEAFRQALKKLRPLFGKTPAASFGPLALKAVRQTMIAAGWTRKNINRQVGRVRQVFRWGVSNELVPGSVVTALEAVEPLMPGRSEAEEAEPIKPADEALITGVSGKVSAQVWAMIQTQLLTGMRPNEICRMRMKDLERGKEGKAAVWKYAPPVHKTAHHGIKRVILIGPMAQAVLTPFLKFDADAFLFSPAESEEARNEARRVDGNPERPHVRKPKPKGCKGDRYTTCSYRRAIERGCDVAFPPPGELARGKVKGVKHQRWETVGEWKLRLGKDDFARAMTWRADHRWHPNQLRHNAATRLREQFGLEAARVVLGHKTAAITEVYAERDVKAAEKIMAQVG